MCRKFLQLLLSCFIQSPPLFCNGSPLWATKECLAAFNIATDHRSLCLKVCRVFKVSQFLRLHMEFSFSITAAALERTFTKPITWDWKVNKYACSLPHSIDKTPKKQLLWTLKMFVSKKCCGSKFQVCTFLYIFLGTLSKHITLIHCNSFLKQINVFLFAAFNTFGISGCSSSVISEYRGGIALLCVPH